MANDVAKKSDVKKSSKAKKERKFKPVRYFKEMFGELKKLTWLTPKELLSHTAAVLVFVVVMALIIYVLDLVFGAGLSAISKIG